METPVRKRKSFSAQEKLYALDQLKKGKQQTQLARDLEINESTLRGWKKDEEKLRSLPRILENETGLQRKKVKFANDERLDSALYQWFVQARSEGVPISGPILKAQAEKFDRLINGNDSKFKASNGWLDRFKKRHTISQVLVSGEIHSADKEAANSYPTELKKLLEEGCYTADQVYNCDETGLCFKMLPNHTLATKTDSHKREGFKQRKDRVTLLFCVNKSGSHKLRPLMIGKARSPRCFHHVNMKALPFEYTNSRNAWMNRSIFEDWFHKTFVPAVWAHLRKLKQEGKALLLLDNCPAHPPAENLFSHDGKIKLCYLPKNTTSAIQPLDQGIISVFKQNYRREMIKRMVADNNSSVDTSLASLNLKEVCHLGGKAWDAISARCIERCWIKGLGPAFLSSTHDDGNDDEPEFTRLIEADVRLAEEALREYEHSHHDILNWFSADDICPIYEHMSDDEIVANVSGKNEAAPSEPETSGANDNDDDDGTSTPPPKVSEAVKHLEASLRWLETQDVDSIKILQLRSILDFARSQQSAANKQTTLDSFLKK
ncbi:tigger transposable element derived 5 [Chelydra serpentina]|uniref:Tigger transposable element derived 5 n=1 Tax=Chelydra serpentina TaxID=8475 RepID=A0A8T1T7S9_CHESE|nr:tigger transposable element derived 5 [Chelydra serpentina]